MFGPQAEKVGHHWCTGTLWLVQSCEMLYSITEKNLSNHFSCHDPHTTVILLQRLYLQLDGTSVRGKDIFKTQKYTQYGTK